jgi:hypothetical protein
MHEYQIRSGLVQFLVHDCMHMVYENEELCVQKQGDFVHNGGKFCTQWLQILYTLLCVSLYVILTCNSYTFLVWCEGNLSPVYRVHG